MTDTLVLRVEKRIENVKRNINKVIYNTMAELVIRVDERSPVGDIALWSPESRRRAPPDYRGGQFRGNWQLGVDSIPQGILWGNIDPSGVQTVGKNIAAIPERAGYGKKYYLVNNLPYARRLEDGHSSQCPPGGMLRLARLEYKSIVAQVIADVKASGGRVL